MKDYGYYYYQDAEGTARAVKVKDCTGGGEAIIIAPLSLYYKRNVRAE